MICIAVLHLRYYNVFIKYVSMSGDKCEQEELEEKAFD